MKPLAEPLAQCPDLLGEVVGALRLLGLAGQEREAKILYLALTSRIFERPINVAVKGPSSGGKSYLVEQCLKQFPKSAYYALTAMSERATAYSQEPLSHRFLVIYEAAGLGGDFAQYLVRSLLSEGRVRYETVEKGEDNRQKARLIEREGPTGLIITTTKTVLHPENETRILSLDADDTPEQTRAVLLAHARGEKPEAVDLAPFVILQRVLELERPLVVVPFAETIAQGCNAMAVRLRRDFPMVLTMVKAHAVLYAHYRTRDKQGRVMATIEDYQAIYKLVADLVAYGTGQKVSETVRRIVGAVVALVGDDSDHAGVSVQKVADYLQVHKTTALRRVKKAISDGYLDNKTKPPVYKLVLGDPLPDHQTVLPPPDAIRKNLYPPGTGATLQPYKELSDSSDSYGLHPSCNPTATMQPLGNPPQGLQGCISLDTVQPGLQPDNHKEILDKKTGLAGLHENQGGMGELKLSSGHLEALIKEGGEIEL